MRAAMGWVAIAAVAAAAAIPATVGSAAPAPASAPAAQPLELVRQYNARDFGTPGWRRVLLELRSGVTVTRTFRILHFWRRIGGQVRSLVVLEQPPGLRGTSYLLEEDPRVPTGMELFLRLSAGRRQVLTITPSRFEEGLLGSDFAYSDLRWQIPTTGFRLTLAGEGRLLGRQVWMVDAEPATPEAARSTSWARVRYYLCPQPALLLGADFYRAAGAAPWKRLRVDSIALVGHTWTPTRMQMLLAAGRNSLLTLRDLGPAPDAIGPDLFVPEMLQTVVARADAAAAAGLLRRVGP